MNIKPFGGDAHMWKFWVTTACVLLPAWFFALWTARTEVVILSADVIGYLKDIRCFVTSKWIRSDTAWTQYRDARQRFRNKDHLRRRMAEHKETEKYLAEMTIV